LDLNGKPCTILAQVLLEKLKQAIAKDGAKGYCKRRVENYRESAKSQYVPPVMMAMACLRIGDKQCAFEWLEKASMSATT
jgi:hypothetical protein